MSGQRREVEVELITDEKRQTVSDQALSQNVDDLYWLLGTSVQKKTDLASPIAHFPWHGNQRRDKGNLLFSLNGERKTPSSKTNRCLQYALREARWMQGERSCSQESGHTTMTAWYPWVLSCKVCSDVSSLSHLSVVMVQSD